MLSVVVHSAASYNNMSSNGSHEFYHVTVDHTLDSAEVCEEGSEYIAGCSTCTLSNGHHVLHMLSTFGTRQ